MDRLILTVEDVLARDSFKCATVVAGKTGLHRQVKWVHILEATDSIETFVNENELILTTGIGLGKDINSRLTFIKNLIHIGAACICFEKGPHFEEVPDKIVTLANEHDFPIILFEETVRFTAITQDIHTEIINYHYNQLSEIDKISQRFLALSLFPNGILKILQELHRLFQNNALFLSNDAQSYYYPVEVKDVATTTHDYIFSNPAISSDQKYFTLNNKNFAFLPVRSLRQMWGYLCLQIDKVIPDEFTFIILDRAAIAIAQILLRNQTIEERKINNEDELVRRLVSGEGVSSEMFHSHFPTTKNKLNYTVCVIQLQISEDIIRKYGWETVKMELSTTVQAAFRRNHILSAISVRRHEIVVVSPIRKAQNHHDKSQFIEVANQIKGIENEFVHGKDLLIGISKVTNQLINAKEAYEEAKLVLQMKKAALTESLFFKDLGAYRILLRLKNDDFLQSFVDDYLKDLLDYDEKTGSDLFNTLQVYLQCKGSKTKAAEQLYIVRQTLYHRIDKIESLLGSDFTEPLNRMTLEVAIMAYHIIKQFKK